MAPRRTAVSVLGLFAALASVQTATALTSDLSCPAETFVCLGDADCASCLEALQSGDIDLTTLFDECSEFYAGVSLTNDGPWFAAVRVCLRRPWRSERWYYCCIAVESRWGACTYYMRLQRHAFLIGFGDGPVFTQTSSAW